MSTKKVYQIRHFPKVGRLIIACNDQNQLVLVSTVSIQTIEPTWVLAQSLEGEEAEKCSILTKTLEQLEEYFRGERKVFELDCAFEGSPYQQKIWKHMKECLLYGQTISYSALAKQVQAKYNMKTSARAIGSANRLNPLMLVVPCHRVIGADGSLVGFAGGLPMKEYLLKLESGSKEEKKEEPQTKKRKLEEPTTLDFL